jgi:outer membrane protein OmpA-like peptidoglycan-associated protein
MQLAVTAPQSQAWSLPKVAALQFGGTGVDAGSDSAVDSAGNIYTVGIFSSTVDFDSSDSIFNLTSAGGYDAYITKNDKNGNFLWAKQFGGSGNESANSVAIDSSSNVVIGGAISAGSNIRIAGQSESNFTSTDAILLKLDSNGNFLWRNIYSSPGAESIRDVALDTTTGQIYTIGTTNAPSGTPAAAFGKLTNFKAQIGTADIFVNKVSDTGTAIWTGSFGSYAQDEANSIAFGNGKVYIVGAIGYSITGGAFSIASTDRTSWITSTDMPYTGVAASATMVGYALQLDATSGDFGWSKTFGSTVSTHKTSLRTVAYNAADGGSIWVGGSFNGSTTWTNPGVTSTRTSTNDAVTVSNSLLVKIKSNGVTQSVWNAQSCGPNQVNGIAVTGDHEIVVTGNFQSISSMADCIFEPTTIPGSGKVIKTIGTIADGYIFKMSETLMATSPDLWALGPASINWIKTFGNNAAGSENGGNVTVDASGMLHLTGTFGAPQLVLDTSTATAGQLTNKGTIDGFVWKLSPLGGSAISVPDAPTAVTATLNGTTASVSFIAPANGGGSPITSYTVTAYDGSGVAISPAITVTGASSPISVPNLVSAVSPGNSYTFKVKATNAIGTGAESLISNAVAVITPSAPAAPTIGAAAFIGNSGSPRYSVSFTPPTNTGSAPITSYTATLYIGGVATAFKVSGTSSPITFSQPSGATMPNVSPYTFVVTATNSVGTSSPSSQSNAISSTTATSMVLASAPTIDDVTIAEGSTSASITLTAPTSVGTQAFARYKLVAFVNGVATGIETTTAGTSSPVALTGLTTGVTYTFIAYAINYENSGNTGVLGTSPPSNEFGPITAQPLRVPGAPTGLSGTTSLTPVLTWTAPTTGGAVDSYTVTLTPLNGGAALTCTPVGTATTCTVSAGGTDGKVYSVSVVANNAAGSGPAVTRTISLPTSPGTPSITQVNVSMKSHSSFTTETGTITFTTPLDGGSAITSYTIKAYYGASSSETFTATSSPFTFTRNLYSESCYASYSCVKIKYFTVIATNAIGDSSESDPVSMLPGQTGAVTVQKAGNTQMTVKVAPSTFPSEATKIRIYALTQQPANEVAASPSDNIGNLKNSSNETITATKYCDAYAPSWTCTVLELDNNGATGTDYWFIGRAINDVGFSATGGLHPSTSSCTFIKTSDPATCVTSKGKTTQDPPLAPTGVTASVSTAGVASVNWTVSSGATGYVVVATPVGGGAVETRTVSSGSATSLSPVTGLTAGTQYTFAVYATNAGGSSAYSSVTPAYAVGAPPAAPTALSVTKSSSNYVIAFTPPITTTETATVTSFTFTATSSTGEVRTVETSTVTSPYTFTGLSSESSWSFTVTSNSGAGSSEPSASVAVRALLVKAQAVSVSQGTAAFTFPVKYFDSDNLENFSPGTENTGWIDPTCNIPDTYSTSTPVGTYTITCASANGGSLYDISSYTTALLTVTASAPQMPTGVSASLSGTSASVSFTPGANSSGATYTVVVYANGVLSTITATGNSSPITVTGLTPGVVYSFGVKATNSVGTSATSTLTSNARLLQKVFVIPNAQTVSVGTSLVSFTSVYQTTAFDASTSVSPSFGNIGFTAPSCNTSPAYSSSTAAGSYDITCSGGNGGSLYDFDFSYTNTLLVTANTSMPAAPTNLAVTATTSSSASVSFTPPTVPISPVVTSYTVTATPIGGGASISSTITAPVSAATISGLSSGTSYKFQIVANSSGGASLPASASLMTSTPAPAPAPAPASAPAPAAPPAPSQVTAVAVSGSGSNSAVISFVPAPATSAGTVFTVTAYVNGVATLLTATGSTSPITIQGLTPGVAYTFKVTASNSAGTSTPSAGSVTIVIPAKNTDSKPSNKPAENSNIGKSASLQIYFDSNSWFVNAKPRKDIKAFVAAMKKRGGPFTIEVVGMVEPTRIQPIPVAQLSKARANSVARLLKAAGLRGRYDVKGGGLSAFRGPKSRYTQIVVTWTR